MEIVEYKCEKCGNDKSYRKKNDCIEYGECTKCGAMTYNKKIAEPKQALVRCPYCNSYKVEKISKVSKAAYIATLGILSMGKVSKQWHCNNCKSDF